MMTDAVSWLVEATIKAGKADDLKTMFGETSRLSMAGEPKTLNYEWAISEDGTIAHLREHYADSDAAQKHLTAFNAHFADRFMALVDAVNIYVYGNPSPALRQELASSKPVYMPDSGGFAR